MARVKEDLDGKRGRERTAFSIVGFSLGCLLPLRLKMR